MSDCLFKREITIKRKDSELNLKAKKIYVDCRKCINCQRRKRFSDIQRVMIEAKNFKYKLMLTLTYNNEHIRFIDFTRKFEKAYNEAKLTKKEYYEKLFYYNKVIKFVRSFELKKANAEQKALYYYLVNEYTTLHYKDITKYLDTVRKSVSRDKKCVDKKYKYYGCGEYPQVRTNRGRGHYHILFLFNDLDIVHNFIKKWNYGNTVVDRGDNQMNENIELKYRNTNKAKLNMNITLENKENDIERILNYIKNKNVKLEIKDNVYEVLYIAAYTNKKMSYNFMNELNREKESKSKWWTLRDLYKHLKFKNINEILKNERQEKLKERREGRISETKEDAFIIKSKDLAREYIKNNLDYFIENLTVKKTHITNNNFNNLFKEFQTSEFLQSKYIRDRVVAELRSQNRDNEALDYIERKNKIVSDMRKRELNELYVLDKNDFEIIEYDDKTIDIYDKNNDKNYYNLKTAKERLREQRELNESKKKQMFMIDRKEIKSDIFENEITSDKIKKRLKDLSENMQLKIIENMIDSNPLQFPQPLWEKERL